jgi:UDP-N-acetylglucosamine 2-epimerase (non-hydrolysing)
MKVLVVIGTRPEAIKMAPIIQELRNRPKAFEVAVCLTAQHRDMLDQVTQLFEIPVDHDLDLMQENQTIFQLTSRILLALEPVFKEEKPDVVLVHGDTTTSFAAALAAYYARIPVGHVEAGMRTYDKHRPFPEEMNRRLADDLCDYHYAATEGCRENLLREHIPEEHIVSPATP